LNPELPEYEAGVANHSTTAFYIKISNLLKRDKWYLFRPVFLLLSFPAVAMKVHENKKRFISSINLYCSFSSRYVTFEGKSNH
jgi:hypothetical protein